MKTYDPDPSTHDDPEALGPRLDYARERIARLKAELHDVAETLCRHHSVSCEHGGALWLTCGRCPWHESVVQRIPGRGGCVSCPHCCGCAVVPS